MSHLTAEQRYTIESLRTKGFKQTYIAEIINKDKSVICRELKRKNQVSFNLTNLTYLPIH